ncbi:MAG: glycoside hydrolase family 19 protein [Methylobacter sp.]
MQITKLKGYVTDTVLDQLPGIAELTTPMRLAHFLAQNDHESGGFKRTVENLNYSVDGLRRTFPKYFPGQLAEDYARNPAKIGARVYADRMGNGSEASGDGFRYRGRGYIQLTGRDNYAAFSDFIGEDCITNPDLVATKYPLASAGWFFTKNKIWAVCDSGISDAEITSVTKKVNGGTNGLPDRTALFNKYWVLLNS